MKRVFEKSVRIAASAAAVFAWHEEPGALALLIPPGAPIRILEHTGGIRDGARVVLSMGFGPFAMRWVARHQNYRPGESFEDVQDHGPFASWKHTHTMHPDGLHSILTDHVEYQLPFGPLGDLAAPIVRAQLEQTFAYRHQVTQKAFEQ